MPVKHPSIQYDNLKDDLKAVQHLRSIFRRLLVPSPAERSPMVVETCYAWVTHGHEHLFVRVQFELTTSVQFELAEAAKAAYRSRWEIKVPLSVNFNFMSNSVLSLNVPHVSQAQTYNSPELLGENPPDYSDHAIVENFYIEAAHALVSNGNNVQFEYFASNPKGVLDRFQSTKVNLVTWE